MALDHYVSQVHLKRFYSPTLGNRLHAIRKSTLYEFTPPAKDICRLPEGNTNPFLNEERAVEDFLRQVEPNYNAAVEDLSRGAPAPESVKTIAGFAAYVTSCAPAAMRIDSDPLKDTVKTTGMMLDAQGRLPKPPPELGANSFTELVQRGVVDIDVDPKYPQAIGITQISKTAIGFANFKWDIIINEFPDSPFFTSDFPVAIETTSHPEIVNRLIPLTPEIAVRMKPDPRLRYQPRLFDTALSHFEARRRRASRSEILAINRLIVRCAEDEVYYRDNLPWVAPFVRKNRYFRIESVTSTSKAPRGVRLFFMKKLVERKPTAPPAR